MALDTNSRLFMPHDSEAGDAGLSAVRQLAWARWLEIGLP